MNDKKWAFLLAILWGAGIGLFPLFMGQASVPATAIVDAKMKAQAQMEIDLEKERLLVNGVDRVHGGKAAMLVDNYTYIPVRLLEQLGGDVRWDGQAKKVFVNMN
ncbi:hypothetical protein BEP19_12765 [Ammoniphilus oxalaticus]|uniref:Copper amine oxidase-like N-terminal domain-containing protein n=1 Tax=Ammoniphilus oxalaticus TaxID=66863 RepID=A0A419SH06_9BACL|nr:stalk domain-containing protein [Ammoniphilus oxalaticus]RKD23091.1 hypothetical protein BEP19_12765 [Ammoniphilus oxalaticus]